MTDIDPEKLEEAIGLVAVSAGTWGPADFRAAERLVMDAARAHLATLPKTKEVEVWRVEWAEASPDGWLPQCEVWCEEKDAETHAKNLRDSAPASACVFVTGPHKQRVPA